MSACEQNVALSLNLSGLEGFKAFVQFVSRITFIVALDAAAFGQSLAGLLLANDGAELLQHHLLLDNTVLECARLLVEAIGKAFDVLTGILKVLGLYLGNLFLGQFELLCTLRNMLLDQSFLFVGELNGLWITKLRSRTNLVIDLERKLF